MRIFKTKVFARFARQEDIGDRALCEAIERAERGLIDADLGASVIKQRIARPNEGRSGGFRSIICFRAGDRAFFAYGFPKSRRDNISADELKFFKELAQELLPKADAELEKLIEREAITEVKCDEEDL